MSLGLWCLALLGWTCATVGTLSGGPEDKQPPRIDSLRSTPNFQVRFKKQQIQLTFDEWIKLTDVFNQVVMSPPLKKGKPEVTLRKKTVRVDFPEDEELRPNATYIINFGEAVKDYTQGNIAENLRFVFSTGDYIDSLELSGSIVDAFTGEAVDAARMMLYDNLADTVVRTETPFYFSKTDKQGQFKLQNLRADTFKTFALLSSDPNYIYDQTSEKIGFLDTFIILQDSMPLNLTIRLFQENPPLKLTDKKKGGFGYQKLGYNQKPYNAVVNTDSVGQKLVQIMEEDSLKLWYNWPTDQSWNLYLQQDTILDTIRIDTTGKIAFFKTAKLRWANAAAADKITDINPFQGISMTFNHPLSSLDSNKINLLEDTLLQRVSPQVSIDSLDPRKLSIQYPWKAEMSYQLQLLPGALTDMYGLSHDTLKVKYLAHGADDFGQYTINITELDSSMQYVLQVLKGKKTVKEQLLRASKTHQLVLEGMPLGNDYSILLIEDKWPNGRWDTGNYDKKRQPERLLRAPLQELRANFEAEEQINGKF